MELGALDYLAKPYDLGQLSAVFMEALKPRGARSGSARTDGRGNV